MRPEPTQERGRSSPAVCPPAKHFPPEKGIWQARASLSQRNKCQGVPRGGWIPQFSRYYSAAINRASHTGGER